MKILLLLLSLNVVAGTKPDFKKIFGELRSQNLISEAMKIRKYYLPQMRNLKDFNRLTDLEVIEDGGEYFDYYKKVLSNFIVQNAADYLNPNRKGELKIFINNLFPKVVGHSDKRFLAEEGLVFVNTCEGFLNYARQTVQGLKRDFFANYCASRMGDSGPRRQIPVIYGPRILLPGSWDKIHFDDIYKVKRIFLSVEGMNQDTYFDVLVNGKTVGTIYAPGSDPSYIITVNDYADSVTLRSLNGGTAKIVSMIIEVED